MILNTKLKSYSKYALLLLVITLFSSFKVQNDQSRLSINLSGEWQFALDPGNIGINQNWFLKHLTDSVKLPGTTDLNKKGNKNTSVSTYQLNRIYTYAGAAWYNKEVIIPQTWKNKPVQLVMERTKPSKIWIDGNFVGESILLESHQKYDLSKYLTPGKHTISIRIDNNTRLTPYGSVHIYSDDTQTNWNGIIGKFYLESMEKTHITDLQVYPDIAGKKIKVIMAVDNQRKLNKMDVELQITKVLNGQSVKLKPASYTLLCDSIIQLEYVLGDQMDLWDEYHQPVYKLNAIISIKGRYKDNMIVPFGMRKFAANGTNFTINGRTSFLRGKHDACVFPLTGFPPMDTEGWIRVFKIAKSYGINHYRFHTWCPPAAAFDAADEVGMYLQPELPFWGGLESDAVAAKLTAEGLALLKEYANHPSFVMFAPGNEIWSGLNRVEKLITKLKKADSRPLYAQGSNNSIGYSAPMSVQDFHIAARTPYSKDTILTHTRLTHAFIDSKDGGILNTQIPSTTVNYNYSVSQIKMPLVSHEIGQYQIYPDYKEIEKYTGILKASNLIEFRNRLQKSGMFDQNKAFTKASGALAVICYRAEIEAALRTKGMAGFQLLDLQDYPGQGTALVGILDAFMDSKNVVAREEWIQFCNDVVPLLTFDKYCWTVNETFTANVKVANYSNKNIKNKLIWNVTDENNKSITNGEFNPAEIAFGGLQDIGKITIPLLSLKAPEKLTITISIDKSNYKNSYSVWIYPEPQAIKAEDIIISTELNNKLLDQLKNGKKVLFFPSANSVKKNSIGGLFNPEFWNFGMFKGISIGAKKPYSPGSLGLLINPKHPVFNSFPTDFYTNWQWWSIIKNSNPLILNSTANEYRPIVQVIDNLERNDKLGLVFEFNVGKGKLLVCMSRLNEIQDKPEASQLYNSMINYMKSDQFKPEYEINDEKLNQLFQ